MGRLVAFMANSIFRNWTSSVRGFACNEKTAVLLSPQSGIGQVFFLKKKGIFFLFSTKTTKTKVVGGPVFALSYTELPSVLVRNTPLTWNNISVTRLNVGDLFDFASFSALDRFALRYTLSVSNGVLKSSTGNIYG
jgi:hypothetical protein